MMRWLAIALVAAVFGVAADLLFRRLTRDSQLRAIVKRMVAHALELPLYFDEPRVVWRAQKALFIDNAKLLWQIAPPLLAMAVLFVLAYPSLDKYLGHRPLAAGEVAVVDALPPAGFIVETPPVHILRTGVINWRVRATESGADRFPYRGPRAPWLLPFALLSTAAGLTARYTLARG